MSTDFFRATKSKKFDKTTLVKPERVSLLKENQVNYFESVSYQH